jgi:glutathionylspermidine synthase
MYQIEVKRFLVEYAFPTADGWTVTIDVDAMEMGKGNQNKQEKRDAAAACDAWLRANNVTIGAHELHGRIDLAAEKNGQHYLIEVEGDSSRQKEQAFYSAIGQTLLLMNAQRDEATYGVAVPDSPQWRYQIDKLPQYVRGLLRMNLYLVGADSVHTIQFAT